MYKHGGAGPSCRVGGQGWLPRLVAPLFIAKQMLPRYEGTFGVVLTRRPPWGSSSQPSK